MPVVGSVMVLLQATIPGPVRRLLALGLAAPDTVGRRFQALEHYQELSLSVSTWLACIKSRNTSEEIYLSDAVESQEQSCERA